MQYSMTRDIPTRLCISASFHEDEMTKLLENSDTDSGKTPLALAAESVVNTILQKEGLLALSAPIITLDTGKKDGSHAFQCTFETVPPVSLPEDLSSLELRFPREEGEHTHLQEVVDQYLSQNAELVPVHEKRCPAEDEIVLADICGAGENGPVPGMRSLNQKIRLKASAAAPLPEVVALLKTLRPGESAETRVVCPADYPDPLMRGRPVVMTVTLRAIYREIRPAFGDAFAQKKGFKDVFQLKQALFEYAARTYLQRMQRIARETLLDQLMETRTVPVPQALHRRFLEIRLRSVRDFFASADMDAAQLEAVLERIRPEAEAQAMRDARRHTFLLALALREKLVVTTDELEEKLRELAEYQHTPYEELHASMWNNGGINDLYEKLLAEKSLALLGRSARIAA